MTKFDMECDVTTALTLRGKQSKVVSLNMYSTM